MTYLPGAHLQNGYGVGQPCIAERNAPRQISASVVVAAEGEVLQGGDVALAALEDEDRKIWTMLTEPAVPSGEVTPERRKPGDALFVRWCEIIHGMAAIPAESFAGGR